MHSVQDSRKRKFSVCLLTSTSNCDIAGSIAANHPAPQISLLLRDKSGLTRSRVTIETHECNVTATLPRQHPQYPTGDNDGLWKGLSQRGANEQRGARRSHPSQLPPRGRVGWWRGDHVRHHGCHGPRPNRPGGDEELPGTAPGRLPPDWPVARQGRHPRRRHRRPGFRLRAADGGVRLHDHRTPGPHRRPQLHRARRGQPDGHVRPDTDREVQPGAIHERWAGPGWPSGCSPSTTAASKASRSRCSPTRTPMRLSTTRPPLSGPERYRTAKADVYGYVSELLAKATN